MSDIAIRLENLGKQYHIGGRLDTHKTLRDTLAETFMSPFRRLSELLHGQVIRAAELDETIWALKDISCEIKRGEIVGLIGRNGAGKSTLLKILSRITEPTEGYADIHGRVGSLLEVGTGFHPELTGRENIYLNGAILGMKKAQIAQKFDEIVSFAEVAKFIDTPVKHYSSGMYLRLAFAVAAHLEPDILLVDEVLAVGDAVFQKKCLGKMRDVTAQGRTVLFVSHNMAAVQALCQRGILLSEGRVAVDTTAFDAVRSYIADSVGVAIQSLADRKDREGSGQLRFTEFWLENSNGVRINQAITGEDIRFCFAYRAAKPLENVLVAFSLQQYIGEPIIVCETQATAKDFAVVPKTGVFVCEIKKFPLRASRYTGNAYSEVNSYVSDWVHGAFLVDVVDGDFYGTGRLPSKGKVLVLQGWSVCQMSEAWLREEGNAHDLSSAFISPSENPTPIVDSQN
jgi:lipopolysaccharide transport system ATP-binding protein